MGDQRDDAGVATKALAIIPARGGSKGVPRKNIRLLGGRPLIAHTIAVAREAACIDRVVVSTDDDEIAEVAKEYGAEVPFKRPAELATDGAATIPVLLHAAEWLRGKGEACSRIVALQATSPFISAGLIERAFENYLTTESSTLVCLEETHHHPFWLKTVDRGYVSPFINFPGIPTRRQDLPELYFVNGGVYITSYEMLAKKRAIGGSYASQIEGEHVSSVILSGTEAFQIDTEDDFRLAEAMLAMRRPS